MFPHPLGVDNVPKAVSTQDLPGIRLPGGGEKSPELLVLQQSMEQILQSY